MQIYSALLAFSCLACVLGAYLTSLRDALLAGGWRTVNELDRMSSDDKRNTLIVEMGKHSNMAISNLQSFDDSRLIGMAAVVLFLKSEKYRTVDELKRMSYDDQRNTLIVELHNRLDLSIGTLQGKTNQELVALGDIMVTKGQTIEAVTSLTWRLDQAKQVGSVPEILSEQIFDNCRSTVPLDDSFSYQKTVTEVTTFQKTDSINWKVGASVTFKAGIPFLAEGEVTASFELGGEHTWSYGTENAISKSYTKTSSVSVPGGSKIKRQASMKIVKIQVPYTMQVKTQLGTTSTIQGVWNGVTMMQATTTQQSLSCTTGG